MVQQNHDNSFMTKQQILAIKRMKYATMLGFINPVEAICCLGARGFNEGLRRYYELK